MSLAIGLASFPTRLFVVAVGPGLLAVVVIYLIDVTRTGRAFRRNHPVVGCFRPVFARRREFLRQCLFAMDREAMPFDRAARQSSIRKLRS